jgi:hypothetical protein
MSLYLHAIGNPMPMVVVGDPLDCGCELQCRAHSRLPKRDLIRFGFIVAEEQLSGASAERPPSGESL